MMQTIEDVLEMLGGQVATTVSICIDANDRNLLRSLAKQVYNSVALTDRQLSLSLTKIKKYKDELEKNNVDVDKIVTTQSLRRPLREIDRSQVVYLEKIAYGHTSLIVIKYVFSKKFAAEWNRLTKHLIGVQPEVKGFKRILYNEKNIFFLVSKLSTLGFVIDQEIQEIYENIVEIRNFPEKTIPHVKEENGKIKIENTSATCKKFLDEKFPQIADDNFLDFLASAKNCGVYLKSSEIVKKIQNFPATEIAKNILLQKSTKFRINPSRYSLNDVLGIIDELNQWPVLLVMDENSQIFNQIQNVVSALSLKVNPDQINVFFRLKNEQFEGQQFNQFIRDNDLNNHIDSNTKAVFITKNRIPKPLLKSGWLPKTALVFTSNDFGKLAAYLNDIANVYYYNNSVILRHSRIKGLKEIAQL